MGEKPREINHCPIVFSLVLDWFDTSGRHHRAQLLCYALREQMIDCDAMGRKLACYHRTLKSVRRGKVGAWEGKADSRTRGTAAFAHLGVHMKYINHTHVGGCFSTGVLLCASATPAGCVRDAKLHFPS